MTFYFKKHLNQSLKELKNSYDTLSRIIFRLQDKPHKCRSCDKSFATPGDLKSHQFVHSGTWPFRWSCQNKKLGFWSQSYLYNINFVFNKTKVLNCSWIVIYYKLWSKLKHFTDWPLHQFPEKNVVQLFCVLKSLLINSFKHHNRKAELKFLLEILDQVSGLSSRFHEAQQRQESPSRSYLVGATTR